MEMYGWRLKQCSRVLISGNEVKSMYAYLGMRLKVCMQ